MYIGVGVLFYERGRLVVGIIKCRRAPEIGGVLPNNGGIKKEIIREIRQ